MWLNKGNFDGNTMQHEEEKRKYVKRLYLENVTERNNFGKREEDGFQAII